MVIQAVRMMKMPVDQAQVTKIHLTKEAQMLLLMKELLMSHLMEKLHIENLSEKGQFLLQRVLKKEQMKIKNKEAQTHKLKWKMKNM